MRRGRIPIGTLSILLILLLNLLAASPSLHERLHPDANQPGHTCAVTIFTHGKVDAPVVEIVAAAPVLTFEFLPFGYVSIGSTSVDTLPPGRAPPASSLAS